VSNLNDFFSCEERIPQTQARNDRRQYPREHAAEQCCFVFPSCSLSTLSPGGLDNSIGSTSRSDDFSNGMLCVFSFCAVGRLLLQRNELTQKLPTRAYESYPESGMSQGNYMQFAIFRIAFWRRESKPVRYALFACASPCWHEVNARF